jgi:K+-sensing histidine kinase KdpD
MNRNGRVRHPDLSGVLHFLRDEFVEVLRTARTLEVRGQRLSPGERLELVEEVARRAEHAIDAVDEALSSPEKVARERPPVSPLAPTAGLVVAGLEDHARSCRVTIVVGVPSGLYAAMPVDALRQVLHNLVIDACRFARPDSIVQVRAHREDADIVIEVTHRGADDDDDLRLETLGDGDRNHADGRPGVALTLKVVRALAEAFGGATRITARNGRVTSAVALPSVGALGSPIRELADARAGRVHDRRGVLTP